MKRESLMKKLIVAAITLALASPLAFAGPQQEKMKECNASAKTQDLKGDARKSFMKECLSAKKSDDKKPEEKSAPTTQQGKMKQCNQEAGDKALKGDDRKKFMSDCLKK
jgi:hypothetical protein